MGGIVRLDVLLGAAVAHGPGELRLLLLVEYGEVPLEVGVHPLAVRGGDPVGGGEEGECLLVGLGIRLCQPVEALLVEALEVGLGVLRGLALRLLEGLQLLLLLPEEIDDDGEDLEREVHA